MLLIAAAWEGVLLTQGKGRTTWALGRGDAPLIHPVLDIRNREADSGSLQEGHLRRLDRSSLGTVIFLCLGPFSLVRLWSTWRGSCPNTDGVSRQPCRGAGAAPLSLGRIRVLSGDPAFAQAHVFYL